MPRRPGRDRPPARPPPADSLRPGPGRPPAIDFNQATSVPWSTADTNRFRFGCDRRVRTVLFLLQPQRQVYQFIHYYCCCCCCCSNSCFPGPLCRYRACKNMSFAMTRTRVIICAQQRWCLPVSVHCAISPEHTFTVLGLSVVRRLPTVCTKFSLVRIAFNRTIEEARIG